MQCAPASGFAVSTAFSGTTSGWYDEDVARQCSLWVHHVHSSQKIDLEAGSLTYAYYLLPFRQRLGMAMGSVAV